MKEKANALGLFQREEGTLGDKQKMICLILMDMRQKTKKMRNNKYLQGRLIVSVIMDIYLITSQITET